MTMKVNIQDKYVEQFNSFIQTLPEGAITIKTPLDEEIDKRVAEYKSGSMETTPFNQGLDVIREKLASKL